MPIRKHHQPRRFRRTASKNRAIVDSHTCRDRKVWARWLCKCVANNKVVHPNDQAVRISFKMALALADMLDGESDRSRPGGSIRRPGRERI